MNIQELLQKSKSLFENKQYLTAKEYVQAALEQDQDCIEALFLLAQCDEALGKTTAMASTLFKILSIDTSKASVAQAALEAGADIINDVTAFRDPHMPSVAARFRAGTVLMDDRPLPPEANAPAS